ncbi:MAG TPA: ArsR family transcriptional regulator [Anaerolineales bacterium]|nr:ArsR family transcriptional regulator [Anaerolineales bacterium]
MQHKRQEIVDILKQRGGATVEELSKELRITSVTVRHHLDVLRSEGWVGEPTVRHRSSSGRPQHVYSLTPKAKDLFPRNYESLARTLLDEVKSRLDSREVNVIFEGVANRLLAGAPHPVVGEPVEERLDRTINFLNQKGYVARWERLPEGFVVHTRNCPFDGIADQHRELCSLDVMLVSSLTGFALRRVCHMAEGDNSCAYLLQEPTSILR